MNWNDYACAWHNQAEPLAPALELGRALQEFETRRRQRARALLIRDVAEGGTGLAIGAGLLAATVLVREHRWPLALATTLVLGVSAVFVRERFRARRTAPRADAPVALKVASDLDELRHQRELLRTMAAWYLGPLFAALGLFSVYIFLQGPVGSALRSPWFHTGFMVFYLGLYAWIWVVNRTAIRRQLDPAIAELEQLRQELARGPESPRP